MNDAAKDFYVFGNRNYVIALIGWTKDRASAELLELTNNPVITHKRKHNLVGLILGATFNDQQVAVIDTKSGHCITFKTDEEGAVWQAN